MRKSAVGEKKTLEIVGGGGAARMYGDCQVMLMGGGGGGGSAGPLGGTVGSSGSGGAGNNMMIFSAPASSSVALTDPFFSSPHRNPNHNLSSFMASLPPFHGFSNIIPVSTLHFFSFRMPAFLHSFWI